MGKISFKRDSNKICSTVLRLFVCFNFVVAGNLFFCGKVFSEGKDGEQLVDRIVATVNNTPVLYSEIQEKIKGGQIVVVSPYPATMESSPFEQALQDEINFQLMLQKADELELDVNETEVEAEIDRFIKNRQLSKEGLLQALEQQGMTYEQYKEDFADQMLLRKFQGRVISPLVKITDKDVENFYMKKIGTTSEHVLLKLRNIFISAPEASAPAIEEDSAKRAREVHKKLVDGMSFIDAVKMFSDEPNASETGGTMPEIRLLDLSDNIRAEVKKLSEKNFTSPIKTPAGYYIFFLDKKSFSGSGDYVKDKEKLEMELRGMELNIQTQKWLADQRRKTKIKIID